MRPEDAHPPQSSNRFSSARHSDYRIKAAWRLAPPSGFAAISDPPSEGAGGMFFLLAMASARRVAAWPGLMPSASRAIFAKSIGLPALASEKHLIRYKLSDQRGN